MRTSAAAERALLLNFLVHGLAMIAMAALLAPLLPGGGNDDAARVLAIAVHPWRLRAGWFPWQMCALVDLGFAWALFRTPFVGRAAAVATLSVTALAVLVDQSAQLLWITRGVEVARAAAVSRDWATYVEYERILFFWDAGVAGCLYTAAGLGWTWCFAGAGVWSRALTRLSVVMWSLFAAISLGPLLPARLRAGPSLVAGGNALAFLLLEIWFWLLLEVLARRARPFEAWGARAPWRHPRRGTIAAFSNLVANSRALRVLGELTPSIGFSSDISDVIYVSYLVDAARLEPLLPPGLELQRLGRGADEGRYALFTFLTYRHGAFGPTLLGPLRRLFPSPVHSNWRIYVVDPATGRRGIFFATNAIGTWMHAIGARIATEGMPMHLLARGEVTRDASGALTVLLDPGEGSAPDCRATFTPAEPPPFLAPPWSACFADYRAFLAYCVPQDRAMASQPWAGAITRQEIHLGIPLEACEPLAGTIESRAARAIVGDAEPMCFRVARVAFRFEGEERDTTAT